MSSGSPFLPRNEIIVITKNYRANGREEDIPILVYKGEQVETLCELPPGDKIITG